MRQPQEGLPPPVDYPFLRGPLAPFILRPYFDRVSLYIVTRWYMPLSRAWAAAIEAGTDPALFRALTSTAGNGGRWLPASLEAVAARRSVHREVSARWEEAFFGADGSDDRRLAALEVRRQNAAHGFMATRIRYWRLRDLIAPVKWDIRSREEVERCHLHRLSGDGAAFPAPPPIPVETSRRVSGAYGPEYWIRFPSPSPYLGDTAWAHVYEPLKGKDPPTLIFLHGILMEPEMWKGTVDAVTELAAFGVRIVRPEGPWHGRRRPFGSYGGEPVIGRGPAGLIELFEGWVAELAVLIDWARATSRGPVAIGGLSLGALVSQLGATAAVSWPERLRPEAKFLVVTSGDILATAYRGALPAAIGLAGKLEGYGWRGEELDRWLPLLQPSGESAAPPARTVIQLGRVDTVTPFDGGRGLAERWGVPEENLFIHPAGHFSAPLSHYRDTAPLKRFLEVLR